MNSEILVEVRQMLRDITPMNHDCGVHCGAICCQPDEDGNGGVYLFPGEETLIGTDWYDMADGENALGENTKILVCGGRCDRGKRPIGCMIFPLTPVLMNDGSVDVRFDYRARPLCPLLRDGLRGLRPDFIETVRKALTLLASDPEGRDFLEKWQALEEQYNFIL